MNRTILISLLGILAAFGVFMSLVALDIVASPLQLSRDTSDNTSGMCTREARVCSDGTVVSRSGSTCEFTACPSTIIDLMPTTTPDVAPEEQDGGPSDDGQAGDTETPAPDSPVACTMDAKQCPDGSYVGRTGPRCEFVCPTPTTNSNSIFSINGIAMVGPTCPVMQNPPAAACEDKPYQGTIILTNTATSKRYEASTAADGTFSLTLSRGVYGISRPDNGSPFPSCGGKIEILSPGATVPISCDSGIR